MPIMKNMLLLIVVLMEILANVKAEEEATGKPIKECEHKSNDTYTHHVRHETDCHKFYKCLGRYGFLIDCPTLQGVHLVFNEALRICDWEGVPCLDEPTTSVTPPTSNVTETPSTSTVTQTPPTGTRVPPPDCTDNPNRKKPHEDCHKYWMCENGNAIEGTCYEGTNFNPIIAECDYYECKKRV